MSPRGVPSVTSVRPLGSVRSVRSGRSGAASLVGGAMAVALLLTGCLVATTTTYGAGDLRTGWYGNQTTLTPGLVSGGTFGQMWDTAVTGQVYAQPVASNGTIVTATESNDVYGLDEATGAPKWHRQVGTPFNPADVSCSDLTPTIGVTGT